MSSESAQDGSSLALDGDGCGLEVSVRRDKRGFNLCLVVDPDENCSSQELLRKLPQPAPTKAE